MNFRKITSVLYFFTYLGTDTVVLNRIWKVNKIRLCIILKRGFILNIKTLLYSEEHVLK